MKKFFLYIIGIVLVCFIIPILFTERFNVAEVVANETEAKIENKTEQQEVTKEVVEDKLITVLFTKDNEVREMNIEDYLYGVVSAEMPAYFDMEALKAQAVVARTYTLYKIENNASKHNNANICTDSACCQAWISKEDRFEKWAEENREEYWNNITTAVNDTRGKVAKYDGKVINAFFHANSGGKTEIPANVWGGGGYPYLQSVETSGEDGYSQYKSEAEFTKEELIEKLKQRYVDIELKLDEVDILERYESGRIKTIKFGNKELAGVEARTLLGLKSANFDLEVNEDKIKFTVYGYGHGVGMSQTGADSLAKQGLNYSEIIKHFYTGVEIENY